MGLVRNKRAWMRLVEVALAAGLVFSFLMFMQASQKNTKTGASAWSKNSLQQTGEDILGALWIYDSDADGQADLKNYIKTESWALAAQLVSSQLPSNIDFALYLFDNDTEIFKGGNTPPSGKGIETVSVRRMFSGEQGMFCFPGRQCALSLVLWYKQ